MNYTAHPKPFITKGFLLAAAYNIVGILTISKVFTNPKMAELDPAVFSWLGILAIILWGMAYGAVAKSYQSVPTLILVFFVEKMVYVTTWLMWLSKNGSTLPSVFAESPLTGFFFAVYGAGDLAFGLFFLWVAVKGSK